MLSAPKIIELIIIISVLLIFFNPKKLPDLSKALGESIRNFRKGLNDQMENNKNIEEKSENIPSDKPNDMRD